MNTYKKYCPNVFVARCEEEYQKGDVIEISLKYGGSHECTVHNLVGKKDGVFYYSITRTDGFNNQERAKQKADKLSGYAESADRRGSQWQEKSNEGRDFLSLGEPIKVGHHSEGRHRALIQRNWTRMNNAMAEFSKADAFRQRTEYWDNLASKVDLSMPESIEFFEIQLEEATIYHQGLKKGLIPKQHAYSMAYANKKVKELKDKYETALKLWA